MSHIQIKLRLSDKILFEGEYASTKTGLEAAVKDGANLYGANLDGANLYGANLERANLERANLYGANLDGANLYGANLERANLERANLERANLERANLYGANLYGANLYGTNLYGANLYGANLYGANLGSSLEVFKQDFIAEVMKAPHELEAVHIALVAGKINGSMYNDDENGCSCLCGTIGRVRNVVERGEDIKINGISFRANALSPREKWFAMIMPGDTPDKNFAAGEALKWLDEAIMIRDHIRGDTSLTPSSD